LRTVCRTYDISPEMTRNVESRMEYLRKATMEFAILADLAAKANRAASG